jgi:hypothetical protein
LRSPALRTAAVSPRGGGRLHDAGASCPHTWAQDRPCPLASTRSMPARAACARCASARRLAPRRLGSRPRSPGHNPSRSTSTRPIRDHIDEERRFALCILKTDDIHSPSGCRCEFDAQLDDPL